MAKVALGFVETRGNASNLVAMDAMIKTADVDFAKKIGIKVEYFVRVWHYKKWRLANACSQFSSKSGGFGDC